MSNINLNRWLLGRRHFLRGVGASMALPLLDCMAAPRNGEQGSVALPGRSVFVYIPNGVNTLDWQIQQDGRDYEVSPSLEPIRELRDDLTIFSGLHHPHGIGKNHECGKIWLTGANLEVGAGDFRNTVSADQLMADATGRETRFPSLELTVTGGTLAWSRGGVPLPAERKPSLIFERLFGIDPGGVGAARRRLGRRGSVLDVILGDARRMRNRIGTEDRSKLDEYLSAVRDVELRTQRADAWLDIPKPEIAADERARLTRNIPDADAGDYYDTIYDLMLLALRTDMTRVITCMLGSESHSFALPEIGVQQTRHALSHHGGDPIQMGRLSQTDAFMTARLARFLDGLRSYEEHGESLLDRTMVLFGSGMSYGHSHGTANLPTILAGGKGLGLEHGHHVDYNLHTIGRYDLEDTRSYYSVCVKPVDENARLCNLLLTMLERMGVQIDSFGDSQRVLSEIVA